MRISMNLFGLEPARYAELAMAAEDAGLDTLWLSDHLVTPSAYAAEYPYSENGLPGYDHTLGLNDVWVTIAHLAALTSRLRFGPGVFILPLRNPFATALSLATLSRISNGRMQFGVGSGWMREEFDVVGEDFDTRGARFDEDLDVIAGLLTGELFEYHGEHFDFGPAGIGGAPVTDLPVVFGGTSKAALRRLARRGDGWFGPVCELEESVATRTEVEELRAQGPRAGDPITYHPRLVGPIERANVVRYEDAGFEHVVVSGGPILKGLTSSAQRIDAVSALGALAG
jgi:probable F420-dependent oxidoreductase